MKRSQRFENAAALPFVLLLVALNVIVVVALLVYATTELQASRNSGQTEMARGFAQSGIDLAAGLVAANSTNNGFVTYQRVVSNVAGDTNPRLETKIANVAPPDPAKPWARSAVNPAVLHSGFASGTSGVDLNFAVKNDPTAGFIAPRTNLAGWTNLSSNMFRMDWIYIYRNGSINPVGRVAYWTDDESSKLSLNHSGNKDAYDAAWKVATSSSQDWSTFSISRSNKSLWYPNFPAANSSAWIQLGGIAGISANEAIRILQFRGDALMSTNTNANATTNFPSVLAVRIATNTVAATLARQAELGFTATVYSTEPERSYATGRQRYDLLEVLPEPDSAATRTNYRKSTISNIKSAITNNYPQFLNKYDIDEYALALYSAVQYPGYFDFSTLTDIPLNQPTRNFSTNSANTNRFYTRGLPLLNELSIKAVVTKTNDTNNNITVTYDAELIALSQTEGPPNFMGQYENNLRRYWENSIGLPDLFAIDLTFPANTSFGTPLTNNVVRITFPTNNPPPAGAITNRVKNWNGTGTGTSIPLVVPMSTNKSIPGWFGGATIIKGPTNASFSNALTIISSTNIATNLATTSWFFPATIGVSVLFNGTPYQSFSMVPEIVPAATNYSPDTNSPQTIPYHLVAQPRGDNGYRGDPRFSEFVNSVVPNSWTTNNTQANTQASLTPALNHPSWGVDDYGTDPNEPDLMPSSLAFEMNERGLILYNQDKRFGFGPTIQGVGSIGLVPVTTRTGRALAWSTPRFWGAGRPTVNGGQYPPDWLLMDCFHLSVFDKQPQSAGSTNMVFNSFGKINVNSAKSFFQVATGNATSCQTIFDSMTFPARTWDYQTVFNNGTSDNYWGGSCSLQTDAGTNRVLFLNKFSELSTNRTFANNPYATAFEFLADLSAAQLPGNPTWWYAPSTTNNTATNTTDRRAESIVRSLVQKLTTHGNQFSIFSLGQALQVVGGKTNVVGESYLQAVYERAPQYDEATGAITNGAGGAPPMRQLYLRELRY
ncbi:MAG: hypothetical protein WCS65_16270 [Verrucomicrobiae bacterium]